MSPDNATAHMAAEYDQGVRQSVPFYDEFQRQTLDLVRTVKPEPAGWLDTGCGTGYLVELALPRFPQTQFILADPAPSMLDQARQRLTGWPERRVTFLPPLSSEALLPAQFDKPLQVVTALMCHHYLQPSQRQRAVKACHDLLDEGGLLVVFEIVDLATPAETDIGLERWRNFQLEAGRPPSAVEAHLQRFKRDILPITVEAHLALLKSAGFQTAGHFWLSQMQAGFYAIK